MLHLVVSTSNISTIDEQWRKLRLRLTLIYIAIGLLLIIMSGAGHIRLLNEVGRTFGGFFWAIDNTDNHIAVVSTPPQVPDMPVSAESLTGSAHIIAANG